MPLYLELKSKATIEAAKKLAGENEMASVFVGHVDDDKRRKIPMLEVRSRTTMDAVRARLNKLKCGGSISLKHHETSKVHRGVKKTSPRRKMSPKSIEARRAASAKRRVSKAVAKKSSPQAREYLRSQAMRRKASLRRRRSSSGMSLSEFKAMVRGDLAARGLPTSPKRKQRARMSSPERKERRRSRSAARRHQMRWAVDAVMMDVYPRLPAALAEQRSKRSQVAMRALRRVARDHLAKGASKALAGYNVLAVAKNRGYDVKMGKLSKSAKAAIKAASPKRKSPRRSPSRRRSPRRYGQ